MKTDYQKFYDMARKLTERPMLFDPFTKTGKNKKEELMKMPFIKHEIVDLKEAIQENKESVDKLNQKIQELEKENASLQNTVTELTNKNYTYKQNDHKYKNEKKQFQNGHGITLRKVQADYKEVQEEKRSLEVKIQKLSDNLKAYSSKPNIDIVALQAALTDIKQRKNTEQIRLDT